MQEASTSDRAVPGTLEVQVNGEAQRIPAGCSLQQLLARLGLGDRRVAAAVNREVIARSRHAATKLADGDRVEILEAVGGG